MKYNVDTKLKTGMTVLYMASYEQWDRKNMVGYWQNTHGYFD